MPPAGGRLTQPAVVNSEKVIQDAGKADLVSHGILCFPAVGHALHTHPGISCLAPWGYTRINFLHGRMSGLLLTLSGKWFGHTWLWRRLKYPGDLRLRTPESVSQIPRLTPGSGISILLWTMFLQMQNLAAHRHLRVPAFHFYITGFIQ